MYEKTTERALSLSKLVLSLFFLLSSSLRRQSVFRLNKYVVTPKEYKTLFPSPIRVDKKTSQKEAKETELRPTKAKRFEISFFYCVFLKKSDQTTKMDHIRRLTALFASLETRKCAHFYIISSDKRRTLIGNDARKLSPIVLSYKKTNRDKRRRRILHNNGVTNRRLCRRRRGD